MDFRSKRMFINLLLLSLLSSLSACNSLKLINDEQSESEVPQSTKTRSNKMMLKEPPLVFEGQNQCTLLPLMADLTRSYEQRVYIENGHVCSKRKRAY